MDDFYNRQINAQAASAQDETYVDIRALLRILWRQRITLVMIIFIGMTMTLISLHFVKPVYSARGLLLIEPRAQQDSFEKIQSFISNIRLDTSGVLSEIEVLRSRTLARLVVDRLDLMTDPEFNPRFAGGGQKAQDEGGFRRLSVYRSELEKLPPEVVDREIAGVVTRFLNNLSVRPIAGSFAIQVDFRSHDPNKAALIANTVLDVYIEQRLEQKFRATKKVTDWLDRRLQDLREQVRESEAAVEAYKREHNLVQGARTVVSAEQLSQLNSQLVQAQAKKAEAEARLSEVRDLRRSPEKVEGSYEIINSNMIQSLRMDEMRKEARLSELSAQFGKNHPTIRNLKSELGELRRGIQHEMKKIVDSVENEVELAQARIDALRQGLDEIEGQRMQEDRAMIRLRELEREAESTRLIFDTFLQTYKRSNEQEELQEAEARVISYAVVPSSPVSPNRMLIMSLAAALSLFVGLAVVILREKMDNAFRSASQIESLLGYPCYQLIPLVKNMDQPQLVRYVINKPASVVAEAVRTLRMVVNLRARDKKKPKVITVTSSDHGEGKTTLSMWMASVAAKSGEKVIIIDADLRRPNAHKALRISNDVTLVEYLTGQKELDEVIQKDEKTGAHMILGRSVPNSALDLVSSEKMRKLIESLRQVYDLVIIDTAPCMAVSDARVLASLSDQTLYAIAWDRTPRELVMSGTKYFSDVGYEPLAFVLTHVDVKRHARYGYGDTVYYYGCYKEHFAD